ncbi:hypothetical protein [Ruminococcus sp. HUN007]|uniref:hypothetical protein n=1 Tax=Ruminococcus sp. HUN007 TaxID=1514668 RepID=UPI0005D1E643|nr:hypothetical protein [Ruminococcus sp. HUN007]
MNLFKIPYFCRKERYDDASESGSCLRFLEDYEESGDYSELYAPDDCPYCNGTGNSYTGGACVNCNGTGKIRIESEVKR